MVDTSVYPQTITKQGYKLLKIPDNPMADSRGYVYEHRFIMSEIIGRPLKKTEIVHHKDGNGLNNSPDNLELYKNISHHKVRHRGFEKSRKYPEEENPIVDCKCGCGGKLQKYDGSGRPRKYISGHNRKGIGKRNSIEMTTCLCGCGTQFRKFDKFGRERKFVTGHNSNINSNLKKRKDR